MCQDFPMYKKKRLGNSEPDIECIFGLYAINNTADSFIFEANVNNLTCIS